MATDTTLTNAVKTLIRHYGADALKDAIRGATEPTKQAAAGRPAGATDAELNWQDDHALRLAAELLLNPKTPYAGSQKRKRAADTTHAALDTAVHMKIRLGHYRKGVAAETHVRRLRRKLKDGDMPPPAASPCPNSPHDAGLWMRNALLLALLADGENLPLDQLNKEVAALLHIKENRSEWARDNLRTAVPTDGDTRSLDLFGGAVMTALRHIAENHPNLEEAIHNIFGH